MLIVERRGGYADETLAVASGGHPIARVRYIEIVVIVIKTNLFHTFK